jgi:hypothetical protein
MKKHVIWQNTDINIEDWRDGYMEFCDINDIEPGDDSAIIEWAIDINNEYLNDEKMNLDKIVDNDIICIADVGRWNGRVYGCKILDNNINNIFTVYDDYIEYYGNGRDIVATGTHHDGTNYYIFRKIRAGRDIDKFLEDIHNNKPITLAKLNYYTESLYNDVASVYGW